MCKNELDEVLKEFTEHFEITDTIGFTLIMATTVAHQLPGEMVWLRFYGASRAGKTEILRAIARHEGSAEMEVLTPAAIRGGFRGGRRILERLDGKLVITKDLASLLTKRRDFRTEIFGLLRNVKDGQLTADFGTAEGHIEFKAKFDWIIGTTPVFAQYRQFEGLLGSRYIDLHWRPAPREAMIMRAIENNPKLPGIRDAIAQSVCKLIDTSKNEAHNCPLYLPDESKKLIADWADLTAILRSPVARDREHRVMYPPEPEVGTDLAQSFSRIAFGLRLLNVDDCTKYIARLAQDTIPYSRLDIIKELVFGTMSETSTRNINRRGYYDLEDYSELGVVYKVGTRWQLTTELKPRIEALVNCWD